MAGRKPLELLRGMVRSSYEKAICRKFAVWWIWVGAGGTGKSQGALHGIDDYFRIAGQTPDINKIAQDKMQIIEMYSGLKFQEPGIMDEAVEIDSRRAQDVTNVLITQASVIGRAQSNFMQLCTQDPGMIDKRLRRNGLINAFWYLPRRGTAYVWFTPKSIRRAFDAFARTGDPTVLKEEVVDITGKVRTAEIPNPPDQVEKILPYEGVLLNAYEERKKAHILKSKQKIAELAASLGDGEKNIAWSIHMQGGSWKDQVSEFRKITGKSAATYGRHIQSAVQV